MSWMVDEYSKLVGHWTPGTFTGKPLSIGGSLGRDTATAQGGLYVLEKYFHLTLNPSPKGEGGGTHFGSPSLKEKGLGDEGVLRGKKIVIQ